MKEKIDVVVLTKDSEEILKKCINSIYENIPVNNLIVVDGFSRDKTLDIIQKYSDEHKNVKIFRDNGTRATARQIGIKNVETEYFAFVDSDAILCKNWFEKASRHVDESTGAVWGVNIDVVPGLNSKLFLRLWKQAAKEAFKIRGGMHDTLILSDAVKDITIPKNLHFYEDAYITKWITKKGYKLATPDDLYCLHYRPQSDWTLKESIKFASADIRYGLFHFHALKYSLFYPFFAFYWFLQMVKKSLGGKYEFGLC